MEPLKKKKIEEQIEAEQKAISYDMKEFTIELYVNKYLEKIDEDDNELYVPRTIKGSSFGMRNINLVLSKVYI